MFSSSQIAIQRIIILGVLACTIAGVALCGHGEKASSYSRRPDTVDRNQERERDTESSDIFITTLQIMKNDPIRIVTSYTVCIVI